MRLDLERVLWRYRARRIGADEISRELEKEIDRCVNERERLPEIDIELLRRFGQEVLKLFDRSSEAALRQLGDHRFDQAVNEVRKTDRSLEALHRIISAYGDYKAAFDRRNQLVDDFELEPMSDLPFLRILNRLLTRSYKLLDERRFRKASFVARLCRQLVGQLEARGKSEAILERLRRLEKEPTAVREPQKVAEELGRLRCLAAAGYTALAEKLADDWEIEHCGWRARASSHSEVDSDHQQQGRLERIRQLGETMTTLERRIARWRDQPSRHFTKILSR